MSSRNARRSDEERSRAVALYTALSAAGEAVADGERSAGMLIGAARQAMAPYGVDPEYLEIVNPETLEPLTLLNGPALLALAARIGSTRLIDNATLRPSVTADDDLRAGPQSSNQPTPSTTPDPAPHDPREARATCSA
jgi:pantoate--beta-alanine ligase